MISRRLVTAVISLIAVSAVILGSVETVRRMRAPDPTIPTSHVRRGRLALKVFVTGDVSPVRTAMLVAPSIGGSLQILRLLKSGTSVRAGDVVIEFDPGEQEYNLAQSRFELEQAAQEIIKMNADAAVQQAEEQLELLKAQFDVRRAELETGRNELLPGIAARKNLLDLEEARRRLEQLEQDVESHRRSRQADSDVQQEKLNRAKLAMTIARQNIEDMKVRAPMDGIVSLKQNVDAAGGILYSGMVLPEYREGDQIWPGRLIAEIQDVAQMEIRSQIKEIDRINVSPNQAVEVVLDTLPGHIFHGNVKRVAGMTSQDPIFDEMARTFDAIFQIRADGFPMRSGVTAQVTAFGDCIENALLLPRQALFRKDGKSIVYRRSGEEFVPVEVTIVHAGEDSIEIKGLPEQTEVALIDPSLKTTKSQDVANPASTPFGGGQ